MFVIDDDPAMRELIAAYVRAAGMEATTFENAQQFLEFQLPNRPCCILLDLEMPGLSGLELLESHFKNPRGPGGTCPVIMVTAHANVQAAVKSMKLGAVDFLEKPIDRTTLLKLVFAALDIDRTRRAKVTASEDVRKRLESLSPRERELLAAVVAGKSTKMIADELGISSRTADHHRANLMEKMNATNVADLVRMALEGGFSAPK